jgi:TolA-binding protein
MRGALNLLYDGHKEEARKRFQAIMNKYPNTPTAEQAK